MPCILDDGRVDAICQGFLVVCGVIRRIAGVLDAWKVQVSHLPFAAA